VASTTGVRAKLSRPLDWLVISDHAEMYGHMPQLLGWDPDVLGTEDGKRWHDALKSGDWGLHFSGVTRTEKRFCVTSPRHLGSGGACSAWFLPDFG
jgi:hypothetical protein